MCGICGVYEYKNQMPVEKQILGEMMRVMRHRGPDDAGVYVDNNLAIGMRRLSIIDLDGGKQPIYSEDKNIVIVFNGEIYTYSELTQELKQLGHTFTSASDTETIVHLYEEHGLDCVNRLRGMFAFALWDERRRRLFVARDRLGIKPLYYTLNGNRLIFASEIKAILQHPEVKADLDLESLSHFLSLKYVPSPQTLFKGISSLPPGHFLSCDSNGVGIHRYWDLQFNDTGDDGRSEQEYAEELKALLKESIKLRLRSDVPFGAFLSGGVDSSMVVAFMSELLNEPVKTFSIGFRSDSDDNTDELPYARLIADKFQTTHHEILVGPNDFIDLVHKVIWHLDQPIADQATIATYLLSNLAAQQVKMVLTGEGSDELFAGYARYVGESLYPFVKYVPEALKSLTLSMSNRLPGLRRPKIALYALCQSNESARFTNWFPLFNRDMKARLMSDDFKSALRDWTSNDIFGRQLSQTDARQPLNRMLYVDTKLWLPDFLLLRGDKLSMAASLEARVPLLDHKLVEFAATLPPHLKLSGIKRKYLFKKVCRSLLPTQTINRKKQGFPIPISHWFRSEVRIFIRDILSTKSFKQRGLFDYEYINKLLIEHENQFADHSLLLWGLINLEIWFNLFIDSKIILNCETPAEIVKPSTDEKSIRMGI